MSPTKPRARTVKTNKRKFKPRWASTKTLEINLGSLALLRYNSTSSAMPIRRRIEIAHSARRRDINDINDNDNDIVIVVEEPDFT